MRTDIRHALMALLLTAGARTALAQQPPDIVQSDGVGNTAMGTGALQDNLGQGNNAGNTAIGYLAIQNNYYGAGNTAIGGQALINTPSGNYNTAVGVNTLTSTGGESNDINYETAVGAFALEYDVSGGGNAALGEAALNNNTAGTSNVAIGFNSLLQSRTGVENTAVGTAALQNSNSAANTAVGYGALYKDTSGETNTAVGNNALYSNTTGVGNVALGNNALYNNVRGSYNIGIGYSAGSAVKGGNNIDIGSEGVSTDTGIIRIGTTGTQSTAFIAGIENSKVTGSAVYVTSSGQLGVLASSERFKTQIAPMSGVDKLANLRPVTFHLKSEPTGNLQYGLIAEEVDRVYPELVIRDAAGAVEGVRYDELAPMLLEVTQQRQNRIDEQGAAIHELERQLANLEQKR